MNMDRDDKARSACADKRTFTREGEFKKGYEESLHYH